MTWEELKEKAKEMGYIEQQHMVGDSFAKNGIEFGKCGLIRVYCGHYCNDIKTDCTYDKMLMIMRGLE